MNSRYEYFIVDCLVISQMVRDMNDAAEVGYRFCAMSQTSGSPVVIMERQRKVDEHGNMEEYNPNAK